MADGLATLEGNIVVNVMEQLTAAPPGSESSACKQSYCMNVGDPSCSHRDNEYWLTSVKARISRKQLGSQIGHITVDAG